MRIPQSQVKKTAASELSFSGNDKRYLRIYLRVEYGYNFLITDGNEIQQSFETILRRKRSLYSCFTKVSELTHRTNKNTSHFGNHSFYGKFLTIS